ncbi:hypothetical protein CDL12_11618 [Handroanthus impetiginosus]|uniref:Uncharacterized protein n=1 Tax=Handroanthus impetiginosus TaxID=429701 RepID=A0A2G9HDW6_9LAMI|nr:hypothetical protein CDL12_11618 [Handroanthus impetiginosus]
MDLDRQQHHFRTTSTGSSSTTAAATTSELFICLTSRLSSSSSMKLTKSILSPGRAARDSGPVSLSSSLSRRLRTNGSLKGGASPFFTTTGKKKGCAFENPEPSSPKVTCIGQVRVKTKKKVKQTRSLSKRRSGEVSFRKIDQDGGLHQSEDKVQRYSNASAHYQQQPQECLRHRNQRWVHLPISICEALRGLGAEFSCLFPCKSSCFSTEKEKAEKEKAEKQNGSGGSENGCAAVFARWLVSVNDGEGGKRREIELVVGGGDEAETAERMSMRSSRRHVFEDIEVKDDRIEIKGQSVEGEEEAARVSICIPPKNALLLMRCRSDPMKMASLANRFSWDANAAPKDENEDIDEENNCEQKEVSVEQVEEVQEIPDEGTDEVSVQEGAIHVEPNEEQGIPDEAEAILEMEGGEFGHVEEIQEEELVICSEEMAEERDIEELHQEILENEEELVQEEQKEEEEEVESKMSSFEALLDQEHAENYDDCQIQDEEEVVDNPNCHLSPSTESDEEKEEVIESNEVLPLLEVEKEKEATEESKTVENDTTFMNNDDEIQQLKPQPEAETAPGEDGETTHFEDQEEEEEEEQTAEIPARESEIKNPENQELVTSDEEPKKEKESPVLPDCLLLMMCEPKLSMEVSKETWVCSTDFIRWMPERPRKATKATKAGGCEHEPVKKRLSIDSKPKPEDNDQQLLQQPPRSSCSLPAAAAAASMATMIEQKLVNAVAYEPFVLTRCKSEPMRTAAAKLIPESCFWKNAMRKLEPHRRATLGVGAAGVGF